MKSEAVALRKAIPMAADAEPDQCPAAALGGEGDLHVPASEAAPEQPAKAQRHAHEHALVDRSGRPGKKIVKAEVVPAQYGFFRWCPRNEPYQLRSMALSL
jgi:hypothetical protein